MTAAGGQYGLARRIQTFWLPVCTRSKVDYRNPYQVRHTYASTLLTPGGHPKCPTYGHPNCSTLAMVI